MNENLISLLEYAILQGVELTIRNDPGAIRITGLRLREGGYLTMERNISYRQAIFSKIDLVALEVKTVIDTLSQERQQPSPLGPH